MSAPTLLQMSQNFQHLGSGSSDMPAVDIPSTNNGSNNNNIPFPWKLHELLEVAETDGFNNIVSWLPDQRSFRVHHVDKFVQHIMKRFFKQTKYKSFQRQLNMWGFDRLLSGPGKGGYSHEYFVRGNPSLCCHMTRLKIKGTGNGSSANINRSGGDNTMPSLASNANKLTSVLSPTPISATSLNMLQAAATRNNQPSSASASARALAIAANGNSGSSSSNVQPNNYQLEQVILDQVLQCAIFNGNDEGNIGGGGGGFMPAEGDCVLFEGKSFFLVDDYHSGPNNKIGGSSPPSRPPRAQRRMSIEFSPSTVGDNARSTRSRSRPRRLSLLPVSSMGEATILPSGTTGCGMQAGTGRKLALESMNAAAQYSRNLVGGGNNNPSRKQCRRFSLERVPSSSLGQNNGPVSLNTAGYVLKQLSSF